MGDTYPKLIKERKNMSYNSCKFKYERIALLRSKLATNPKWAVKGCQRIYEYQTTTEQNSSATLEHNGVGFTGADAEIMSSFARQINAGRFVGSHKQMAILFKKMPKYATQLDGIAQTKVSR